MVVVPDSNHVELRYGWTAIDLAGILLTLVGIAGVVWLARAGPVRVAPPTRFWGRVERPDLYPPARPAPLPLAYGGAGATVVGDPAPDRWTDDVVR